jgi:hypothetical protein
MRKRPLSITLISGMFLVAGVIGLAYHATEFKAESTFQHEQVWIFLVRILAIICAVFMLRAANWARWLLLVWIAYHVFLSAFHSPSQLIIHALLLVVVAYFLFRRPASLYFRGEKAESEQLGRDAVTK